MQRTSHLAGPSVYATAVLLLLAVLALVACDAPSGQGSVPEKWRGWKVQHEAPDNWYGYKIIEIYRYRGPYEESSPEKLARWGWKVDRVFQPTAELPERRQEEGDGKEPQESGIDWEKYKAIAAMEEPCVGYTVRLFDRDGFEVASDTACFPLLLLEAKRHEFQTVAKWVEGESGFNSLLHRESKRLAYAEFEYLYQCDLCQ